MNNDSPAAPAYFISIQGSYTDLDVSLFNHRICLARKKESGHRASSFLLSIIDNLLKAQQLSLSNLSFIALDRGPGAFTSLRVIVATVNGLAFGKQVPLIGVNGLSALWQETFLTLSSAPTKPDVIACLLNAYGNDVYYYLKVVKGSTESFNEGCQPIESLEGLPLLTNASSILFVGNGVIMHEARLRSFFGSRVQIHELMQEVASSQIIGSMAYEQWLTGEQKNYHIVPHYLKTQCFTVK